MTRDFWPLAVASSKTVRKIALERQATQALA